MAVELTALCALIATIVFIVWLLTFHPLALGIAVVLGCGVLLSRL